MNNNRRLKRSRATVVDDDDDLDLDDFKQITKHSKTIFSSESNEDYHSSLKSLKKLIPSSTAQAADEQLLFGEMNDWLIRSHVSNEPHNVAEHSSLERNRDDQKWRQFLHHLRSAAQLESWFQCVVNPKLQSLTFECLSDEQLIQLLYRCSRCVVDALALPSNNNNINNSRHYHSSSNNSLDTNEPFQMDSAGRMRSDYSYHSSSSLLSLIYVYPCAYDGGDDSSMPNYSVPDVYLRLLENCGNWVQSRSLLMIQLIMEKPPFPKEEQGGNTNTNDDSEWAKMILYFAQRLVREEDRIEWMRKWLRIKTDVNSVLRDCFDVLFHEMKGCNKSVLDVFVTAAAQEECDLNLLDQLIDKQVKQSLKDLSALNCAQYLKNWIQMGVPSPDPVEKRSTNQLLVNIMEDDPNANNPLWSNMAIDHPVDQLVLVLLTKATSDVCQKLIKEYPVMLRRFMLSADNLITNANRVQYRLKAIEKAICNLFYECDNNQVLSGCCHRTVTYDILSQPTVSVKLKICHIYMSLRLIYRESLLTGNHFKTITPDNLNTLGQFMLSLIDSYDRISIEDLDGFLFQIIVFLQNSFQVATEHFQCNNIMYLMKYLLENIRQKIAGPTEMPQLSNLDLYDVDCVPTSMKFVLKYLGHQFSTVKLQMQSVSEWTESNPFCNTISVLHNLATCVNSHERIQGNLFYLFHQYYHIIGREAGKNRSNSALKAAMSSIIVVIVNAIRVASDPNNLIDGWQVSSDTIQAIGCETFPQEWSNILIDVNWKTDQTSLRSIQNFILNSLNPWWLILIKCIKVHSSFLLPETSSFDEKLSQFIFETCGIISDREIAKIQLNDVQKYAFFIQNYMKELAILFKTHLEDDRIHKPSLLRCIGSLSANKMLLKPFFKLMNKEKKDMFCLMIDCLKSKQTFTRNNACVALHEYLVQGWSYCAKDTQAAVQKNREPLLNCVRDAFILTMKQAQSETDKHIRLIHAGLIEHLFDVILICLQVDKTLQTSDIFISNQKTSIMTSVIACCSTRTIHLVCRIFCCLDMTSDSKHLALMFLDKIARMVSKQKPSHSLRLSIQAFLTSFCDRDNELQRKYSQQLRLS